MQKIKGGFEKTLKL